MAPHERPTPSARKPPKGILETATRLAKAAPDTTATTDRSRYYWRRRARLACDCSAPCRCRFHARPTRLRVEAYASAVALLDALGTPAAPLRAELEALARNGGPEAALAERVARRWTA